MLAMWLIVASVLVVMYVLVFFAYPYFFVPLMRTQQVPKRLPKKVMTSIDLLEKRSKSKYSYLKNAAEYILSTNAGGPRKKVAHMDILFENDLLRLHEKRGFLHAHQFNFLFRALLVRSSYFSDEDVRVRFTIMNLCLHQYVQVYIAGQWYDVDLWAASFGMQLGRHAWGIR